MNELHDEILAIVYKHLPGQHDQLSHGRSGGNSIDEIRNEIRNSDVENVIVVGDDGEIIYRTSGEKSKTIVPKENVNLIQGTVIHNHPTGSGPSPDDMTVLYGTKAKRLIVVTKNTDYIIEPSTKYGWSAPFSIGNYVSGITKLYNYEIAHGANIPNRGAYIAR